MGNNSLLFKILPIPFKGLKWIVVKQAKEDTF